jgi:uncharacterized protein YegP (UPF0339 family)
MRKLFVCAVMLGVMSLLAGGAPSTAFAQGKKDKDKEGKKTMKAAAAGVIEIGEGKDGKFRFSVRNADGKYLAGSAAYATEKDAREAIEELKEVISKAKVTHKAKTDKDKDKDKK